MYTNQAKEFQAPLAHQDELLFLGTDGGADAVWNNYNHRSWHPVMDKTGRTFAKRQILSANAFLPPWNNDVGNQTMYCSDCHGNNVTSTTSVIPDGGTDGNPWGPHGSNNPFLLKGAWVDATGWTGNLLCLKCHSQYEYATPIPDDGSVDNPYEILWGSKANTGFARTYYDPDTGALIGSENLHRLHVHRVGGTWGKMRCTWCHVAVPHGWKNKALLVNLNDVGAEAGQSGSKEVAISSNVYNYTQEPYYYKAKLKIRTFARSGEWNAGNCGSKGKTGANLIPNSQGILTNITTGGMAGCSSGWMSSVCTNPP